MYRKTAVLVSVIFAALFIFQPALELNASGISISPPSYRTPSSGQIRFTGRWNEITSMDMNRNGIFDNLEEMMLEKEYVDIYVDYEHVPTLEDAAVLMGMGLNVTHIFTLAKAIGVNNVPVEKIWKLTNLPGVIMLEPKGEGFLLSDVATPAVMARPSELYSPFTAWELNYTGLGVNIAIVDTGIDDFHPSLVGKFVAGVDFSDFTPARQKPTDGSFDPDDLNGHGTTCAGIATGTGAPEGVYMGAAPGARLVDVRIGRPAGYNPGEITLPGQPTPGPGIVISEDACIAGIEWVVANKDKAWPGAPETNHGIDILSLSWGINVRDSSDGSDLYSRTLDAAVASGVFVANAAGNSGPDNDGFDGLAAASLSISVASSDDKNTIDRGDDVIASYSSRGPRADDGDGNPYNELRPDIAAPGTNIIQAENEQVG
ncbi:MAG: S8 family serine peptidase, partial [Candidatus Thermoplasmatota archaeon]|nr:S8 family serine peptidase [Candidatus Thermoplasmatota archaeon]